MIKTDYDNASIQLFRNEHVLRTFNFKEFVSAKSFKPVNDVRNKLVLASKSTEPRTEEEIEKLNIEFYTTVINIGLANPIPYDEAMELMTTNEIGQFAEEVFIFLISWSSTEAVKQYAKLLSETTKNEIKP